MDYGYEKRMIKHKEEEIEIKNQKIFQISFISFVIGIMLLPIMFYVELLSIIPISILSTSYLTYKIKTTKNYRLYNFLEERYEEYDILEKEEVLKKIAKHNHCELLHTIDPNKVDKVKVKTLIK